MKSKSMVLHSVVMMLVLIAGLELSYAQNTDASPYEGVVTGTNVYVRSGPDGSSTPITKTNKPQKVTVYSVKNGEWLAIGPVPGCYCVIAQKFVEIVGTDKATRKPIGKVTGQNVFIRPAGTLLKKNFKREVQGKLTLGDGVLILGKVDNDSGESWYIIKPPKKVRFYISKDYVKLAGTTDAPDTPSAAPADTTDPTPVTPTPTAVKPTVREEQLSVRQEKEIHKKIRALEKNLVAESSKPLDKQNFENILKKAKKMDVPKNSRWKATHDWLIDYTEREIKLAKRRKDADVIVKNLLDGKQQAPTAPPAAADGKKYNLQGVLMSSVLHKPKKGKPTLYYIRDAETRKILGYVQASHAQANLSRYAGKNVGVKGKPVFDEDIAMQVLEVDDVDILKPVKTPPAPKPIVTPPAPKPEPKPEPVKIPPAPKPVVTPPAPKPEPVKIPPAPKPVVTPPAPKPQPKPEPVKTPPAPKPVVTPPAPKPEPKPEPVKIPPAPKPVVTPPAPKPEPKPEPVKIPPAPKPVVTPPAPKPQPKPEPVKTPPAPKPEPVVVPPAPKPVVTPPAPKPESVRIPPAPKPVVTPPAPKPIPQPDVKPKPTTGASDVVIPAPKPVVTKPAAPKPVDVTPKAPEPASPVMVPIVETGDITVEQEWD